MLFQMSLAGDFSDEQMRVFLQEHTEGGIKTLPDNKYFKRCLAAVRDNMEALDTAISGASDNWKIERISKVDLSLLRLSTAEILFMPDIPAAVSVSEAVDLAKKYSGDGAYRFINGVLGRIVRGKKA
jgi:N utilization substance protein B